MEESDKNRILNFLIGNESIRDFESWVYYDANLESRVGGELYFELIEINYKHKNILDNLREVVLGNYITQNDFEYKRVLKDSGWHQNRRIELNLSKVPNTPEIENAVKIIEEFGGLKFISPEKRENWTLTLVEFLDVPCRIQNMTEYGLNKNLVCFATAHNDHIDLFVDENNKFYQLDNVVSEHLYEYKGLDFEHMMRQLLQLDEEDNFEKLGKLNKPIANTVNSKQGKSWFKKLLGI